MRRAVWLALVAVMVAAGAGCHKASEPRRGEPDGRYTVRGRVEALPDQARPASELIVKHEPIDGFKNPDGTLGMDTMSMPFPLAPGVNLGGIKVGDAVEMDLVVWTTPGHRGYEVRRVGRLPDGTELRFGRAKPAP